MVGLKLVSGYSLPSTGAFSLARVKEHLRVDGDDEDGLIEGYILAAVHYAQELTGRVLLTSTWRQSLDAFPSGSGPILLARSPVQSVTSIAYTDSDGDVTTIASGSLVLESDAEPARVSPDYAVAWPTDESGRPGCVRVTFVAGSATVDDIPEVMAQAVYLLVGHWHSNREAVSVGNIVTSLPFAVDTLLSIARVPWLDYNV